MAELKVKRQTLYIIIAVIITAVVTSAFFIYYPKYQGNNEINQYKKALYDSVLCQYSCPLVDQVVQNTTQKLPEQACVQACTEKLRTINIDGNKFSNSDLQNDNFVKDVESGITNCRTESLNTTTLKVENERFFSCSINFLQSVKDNYSYLN